MCVSVTVESMRTRSPVSTPEAHAISSKVRLIASQVAAPTAPTAACNTDFPGGRRAGSSRAKRCAESESTSANASPR